MEKYIGAKQWKWIQLKTNEMNRMQAVIEHDHMMKDWLKHVRKSKKITCEWTIWRMVKRS